MLRIGYLDYFLTYLCDFNCTRATKNQIDQSIRLFLNVQLPPDLQRRMQMVETARRLAPFLSQTRRNVCPLRSTSASTFLEREVADEQILANHGRVDEAAHPASFSWRLKYRS